MWSGWPARAAIIEGGELAWLAVFEEFEDLIEEAFNQAHGSGDDGGFSLHLFAEVELALIGGSEAIGEGDVDDVLVILGHRGKRADLPFEQPKLGIGVVLQLDVDLLANTHFADIFAAGVELGDDVRGAGDEGKDFIARIDGVMLGPNLEVGDFASQPVGR